MIIPEIWMHLYDVFLFLSTSNDSLCIVRHNSSPVGQDHLSRFNQRLEDTRDVGGGLILKRFFSLQQRLFMRIYYTILYYSSVDTTLSASSTTKM